MPVVRVKQVTATKRLPLWKLSDEMYLNRQLAPSPDGTWTEVRRMQARMREQVMDRQKKDMREMERELSGFRFEPRHAIGDLRPGMWLDGRVSATTDIGVRIDVGAYTERGEWIDGYLHVGQIRQDGEYLEVGKMMNEVYLGEYVRVRVRECVPATGWLSLSMRAEEDLPDLFMGKPRPYIFQDLEAGMKVNGIVRRVWEKWALVDIGAEKLARIHVSQHKREITRYGFARLGRLHQTAYTAYAQGALLEDLYIKDMDMANSFVTLMQNKPRSPLSAAMPTARRGGIPGVEAPPGKEERISGGEQKERDRAEKEKAPWNPYVPHVDEWLEDSMMPDEDTDSWVARTENDIFADMTAKGEFDDEDEDDDFFDENGVPATRLTEDDFDEEFAEDEFAEDDFQEGQFESASDVGFGPNAFSVTELDGWVLDETKPSELVDDADMDKLSEAQIEAMFDDDDDTFSGGRGRGGRSPRR